MKSRTGIVTYDRSFSEGGLSPGHVTSSRFIMTAAHLLMLGIFAAVCAQNITLPPTTTVICYVEIASWSFSKKLKSVKSLNTSINILNT